MQRTLLKSILALLTVFAFVGVRADSADIQPLMLKLTESNLRETAVLVSELEAVGGEQALPLFNALLAGKLYYHKQTKQLFAVEKNDSQYLGYGVQSGELLGEFAKSDLKKVRVNNSLRKQLREIIARINLSSTSSQQRLRAAQTLYGQVGQFNIALIDQRLQVEQSASVKNALVLARAIYISQSGSEVSDRISAIKQFEGSLQPEVSSVLTKLLEKNGQGEYIEANAEIVAVAERVQTNINDKKQFYGFVEQLFFGLSLGSVLFLAAIGLAITFGVMGVINMAHGEMMMLGAYTTFVVQQMMPNFIEYSLLVAVPLAFIIAGSVGVLIERSVIQFLHGRPLETLLATFGISLILQQAVRTVFSPLNRQVITPDWMSGSLQINAVLSITYNRLYILVFALALFVVLLSVLKKTSLGLNVRAVSQNRDMARAMGIKTDRVDALTFGLGSGIAGVAGVALSQLTNVGPNLGQSYIIDSFMVVVFGGVGNLIGTLVQRFR